MINSIPLALLSVVPMCTGAPLASRLEEILQWLRESQQSNRLDTTSGQGSTEWQTTVSVTTDSWSTTVSENTTATTTTIPTVQFSDATMISLIFILIFAAIALFCSWIRRSQDPSQKQKVDKRGGWGGGDRTGTSGQWPLLPMPLYVTRACSGAQQIPGLRHSERQGSGHRCQTALDIRATGWVFQRKMFIQSG